MKKIVLLLVIVSFLGFMVGCNDPKENNTTKTPNAPTETVEEPKESKELETNNKKEDNVVEAKASETKEEEKQSYSVTLFYPTEAYVVDGDESKKMEGISTTIESTKSFLPLETINTLAKGPEKDGLENFITPDLVRSVSISNGIAKVDINKDEVKAGSLEEEVILNQLIKTLLSVDGIKGVSFTVNGEVVDSLSGHYDLTKTYTEEV